MHVISGAGVHIGARFLAGAWQRVHPFARRRLGQHGYVIRAERLQRLQHGRPHLRHRHLLVELHQRRIDIVIGHVGQLQQLAAQLEIAVQLRQAGVGFADQRSIDRLGNVVAGQVHRQRGRVFAGLLGEDVRLHMAEIGGAQRALELAVFAEERIEHRLAVGAIGGIAIEREALIVEPHLLAGGQRDRRPGNVRGDQLLANVARPRKGRRSAGEQVFLIGRQRVIGLAQRIGQEEVEPLLQRVVRCDEGIDLGLADRQNLGRHPGGRFAKRRVQVDRLRLPLLIGGDSQVGIGLQADIGVDARDRPAEIGLRDQRGRQRIGAVAQRALVFRHPRHGGERLLARFVPGGVARIDVAQVPGGARRVRGGRLVLRPHGHGDGKRSKRGGAQRVAASQNGHRQLPNFM